MLHIFNTLSGKKEAFRPIDQNHIGLYTCGPTVYHYVTIGNWRTYTLGDLIYRTLRYSDYKTTYIMNITDVGHLTGDNEGDANQGEDRMEKAKKREGKNAWDIAKFYTDDFIDGMEKMNIIMPKKLTRATDHIAEQITLVQKLEQAGFAYKITDGIYFDVAAYEASGKTYGELSTLDHTSDQVNRIEPNPEKRDPRDFALWKFSPDNEQRDMEWPSPWGVGFPGWHIECSAMSMKYLGEQFDIHVGGEDLRQTHHPNEIAQSEGATGCAPFVNYWMHGAFLLIDGGRMGKSKGNAYTLTDLLAKGFSPLALRYFYFTGHYRHQLNFTWESLGAAQNALDKLHTKTREFKKHTGWKKWFTSIDQTYKEKFTAAVSDDLEMPRALAIMWELVKNPNLSPAKKYVTLLDFDRVLGLGLGELQHAAAQDSEAIPDDVEQLATERKQARADKNWQKSDELRDKIADMGYIVHDTAEGQKVSKNHDIISSDY